MTDSRETSETKYIEARQLLSFLEKRGVKVYEKPIDTLTAPVELKELIKAGKNAESTSQSSKQNPRKKPPPKIVPLTEEELDAAWDDLVISDFIDKYPRTEKYWSDPPYRDQVYCVTSFVPAPGAVPDKDGVYGMMKVRGAFSNETDMRARCRELIETVDSEHKYFQGYIGKPFPCTMNDQKFCAEVETIDIKSKAVETVNAYTQKIHDFETDEKKQVKERTEELTTRIENEKKGNVDPLEKYTELRVKRANIIYNLVEHKGVMADALWQLKDTIIKIEESDLKNPELADQYLENYKKACGEVGIRENENTLIKYLAGPIPFELDTFSIVPAPLPSKKQ